jgi:hypothetical protein
MVIRFYQPITKRNVRVIKKNSPSKKKKLPKNLEALY